MGRIFHTKVYTHPDCPRCFHSLHDMRGWCDDHGAARGLIDTFDSKAEYDRWCWLKSEQDLGRISGLRRQVVYVLCPEQYTIEPCGEKVVKVWWVDGHQFVRKADAQRHCRRQGIALKGITWFEERQVKTRRVLLERAVTYAADFVYRDAAGTLVVEDVKSDYTRHEKDYIIKRKLMLHVHGIRIKEVIV